MPAIDDWDPHEYERPFWAPIGQFVMAFGYLERDIRVSVSRLLQLHDRLQGEVLLAEIKNTKTLLNLIVPLLKALNREPKRLKEANVLVKRLGNVNTLSGEWGWNMQLLQNRPLPGVSEG